MFSFLSKKSASKQARTRFAPSPTGYVHVGSLRTALYNYLYAKQQGGQFVLRVEDTDQSRLVEGAVENLLTMLDWAGIHPDEGVMLDGGAVTEKGECGPYAQSRRLDLYKKYADQLIAEKKAYYCFCTSERLEALRTQQQADKLPARYDGHCRNLDEKIVAENLVQKMPHVIRMAVPKGEMVEFVDRLRGAISIKSDEVDDQVLIKSDGFATYHLAVVVDDYLMKITHIIRGEEWLPSTPKHVLLYRAFGWDVPEFIHVPLLLNSDKSKLSKRQGDVSVEEYRQHGYLPEALINFVALLGWNPGTDDEFFSLDELIKQFDIDKINKSGAVFDIEKLRWMNGEYIKKLPFDRFRELAMPYLTAKYPNIPSDINLDVALAIEQSRVKVLSEVGDGIAFLFTNALSYDGNMLIWKKSDREKTLDCLTRLVSYLENINDSAWVLPQFETTTLVWIKEQGLGNGDVLWPMRWALTGIDRSPTPFEVATMLGKQKSLARLNTAIGLLKK
jgi:nondiscriminating glutamyl-tRNA synthetase